MRERERIGGVEGILGIIILVHLLEGLGGSVILLSSHLLRC